MFYVYIVISLAMFVTGVSLLVQTFRKVKNPMFQMLLGVIGLGLIICSAGVFYVAMH